eukprot:6719550-Prymnesium_polylepis.1
MRHRMSSGGGIGPWQHGGGRRSHLDRHVAPRGLTERRHVEAVERAPEGEVVVARRTDVPAIDEVVTSGREV